MKRIIVLLICMASLSCKNTWNEDDKDSWNEACKENALKWAGSDANAKTYCDCILQKMMLKYPHENDALEHIDSLAQDTALQSCKLLIINN